MSRQLAYMVAASRHPLLMEDGVARDVLWWLADLAHDRNGGRIMAALDKLAETLERSGSQVRRAVDRLEAAGLLIDTGERVGGRRVVVWTVREEVLKNHTFTRDLTPEPEREIPDVPSSRSRRDLVAISSRSRRDLVAISSPMGGDKHKQELKQELDQKQNAGAEARALDAVEAHNAVQLMARAKVAQRGPASMGKRAAKLVEVPVVGAAPLVADAVVELAPGEARVREAIEAAMAIIGTDGQPERTLSLWRTRLRARLVDDGVTEQAVARRLDVVKAAWASLMVSEWHIANGCATRSHFFVRTTRSAEKLEAQAARIADAPRPLPRFRTVGASAPDPEPAFTAEDAARAAEEDDEREFQRLQAKAADDRARLESQRAVVPAQSGPTASSEKMAAFRAAVGGLFGGAQ